MNGAFEEIMDQANQMSQSALAHPFGAPTQALAQSPRLPIQQTTCLFYLPRDLAMYDECCNRLWSGIGKIRYEERTFTKEGEVLVVLSYFTDAPAPPPNPNGGEAAEEAEVRPYRIP